MPCKMVRRKRLKEQRETVASGDTHPHKRKQVCLHCGNSRIDNESLEFTLPRNHDDHIAERGFNSLTHYHSVFKFIPMPQALKIPDAKAAVNKEWEKIEKIPVWQMDKVKSKKDVILQAQKEKRKVHFATMIA